MCDSFSGPQTNGTDPKNECKEKQRSEQEKTHGWDQERATQRRCGSRYVNPTNASHRVDVLVSPRLNPASTTKFLRTAREIAQRLPTVLPFSNGCEKCHTSPEIVNFPRECEMDSVCPNCAGRHFCEPAEHS